MLIAPILPVEARVQKQKRLAACLSDLAHHHHPRHCCFRSCCSGCSPAGSERIAPEPNETHKSAALRNSEALFPVAAAPAGIAPAASVPAAGTGFGAAPVGIAAAGLVPVAVALVASVPAAFALAGSVLAARRMNWAPGAILEAAIVVAPNSGARSAGVSQPGDCSRPELLVEIGTSGCAGSSAIEPRYRCGSVLNANLALTGCYFPE